MPTTRTTMTMKKKKYNARFPPVSIIRAIKIDHGRALQIANWDQLDFFLFHIHLFAGANQENYAD